MGFGIAFAFQIGQLRTFEKEAVMPTALRTQPRPRPPHLAPNRRQSILDPWLHEDPWIKRCVTGQNLVLYIQAQPIAVLAALPFDLVSLNARLFDLRRRSPRGCRG